MRAFDINHPFNRDDHAYLSTVNARLIWRLKIGRACLCAVILVTMAVLGYRLSKGVDLSANELIALLNAPILITAAIGLPTLLIRQLLDRVTPKQAQALIKEAKAKSCVPVIQYLVAVNKQDRSLLRREWVGLKKALMGMKSELGKRKA